MASCGKCLQTSFPSPHPNFELMNGAKIGEGFGCLAVFAVIGFIAAIYFLVMAAIWLYNHVNII